MGRQYLTPAIYYSVSGNSFLYLLKVIHCCFARSIQTIFTLISQQIKRGEPKATIPLVIKIMQFFSLFRSTVNHPFFSAVNAKGRIRDNFKASYGNRHAAGDTISVFIFLYQLECLVDLIEFMREPSCYIPLIVPPIHELTVTSQGRGAPSS